MRQAFVALALASGFGVASAAPMVANGSFEDTVIYSGYFTTLNSSFEGWTLQAGNVDVVNSGGWAPYSGNQSLDLSGSQAGRIYQNVSGFIPNQQYVLTYYINGTNVGDAKSSLTFVGGTSETGVIFDTAISNNTWLRRDVTFTALQTNVGITFQSLNNSNTGMAIDSVSVAAVPEPHEWAMMLAGLGIVGWAARRSKGQQGAAPLAAA